MSYRVGVIGTVGTPARYGGFETLAEQLSINLDPKEIYLVIYCQRSAYESNERRTKTSGHDRVFIPFRANGWQSLIYDGISILHAVMCRRVDCLLVLGTSGAWLLPVARALNPSLRIVTNIDGIEWRREKFSDGTRRLLRSLERLAVEASDVIVLDNLALFPIFSKSYPRSATCIAYGGDHTIGCSSKLIEVAEPTSHRPWLVVSRIEPENNTEMIIEAAVAAKVPLTIVGNWSSSKYGRRLISCKYPEFINLHLPVYDLDYLFEIRKKSIGYIHGHSVGGTNPSLVEGLFHTDRILAYDCSFNRATLFDEGDYFSSSEDLSTLLLSANSGTICRHKLDLLQQEYLWENIAKKYANALFS